MTVRPLRPCAYPGCPKLVQPPARYCEQHRQHERQSARQYDAERGTAHQRDYGARWRRERAMHLAREPLCRDCLAEGRVTPATEVHHEPDRNDPNYELVSLCRLHHNRRTARQVAEWRAAGTPRG